MNILVTGANGGFGSAFVPLLRAHFSDAVVSSGRADIAATHYMQCDFTDQKSVERLIRTVKPTIIFHLVGSFTGQFEQDFSINTLSAKYIFDSILNVRLKTRVVIFGSAAEYGAVELSQNPVSEDLPCRPISVYGLTKSFQTELARYYVRVKDMNIVIARIFNLATPGLSTRLFFGKAESLINEYKKGEISQIEFGNLDSHRDYIELEQAFEQLLAVAQNGISGEIYNIGSGRAQQMRSLLKEMLAGHGIPGYPVLESIPLVKSVIGFDVPIIYADISKVTRLL